MLELSRIPGYDWCGIYRLEGDTLVLDAFVGANTDHTRIPVGRGVCGAAVAEDRNQVVADVSRLDNYLSCSADTKSEIVVLIKLGGTILGQVDVDSHTSGAFGVDDEKFLSEIGELIASRWES